MEMSNNRCCAERYTYRANRESRGIKGRAHNFRGDGVPAIKGCFGLPRMYSELKVSVNENFSTSLDFVFFGFLA